MMGAGNSNPIGTASAIADEQRPALTRMGEALRGEPGFTGDAPGMPGHGTRLIRSRLDKRLDPCRMDRLRQEARPSHLFAAQKGRAARTHEAL